MAINRYNKQDFELAENRTKVTPGESLKILRQTQELSQLALSELTGISQPNISALESGRIQIGRERALMLARALKVHPAVILFPGTALSSIRIIQTGQNRLLLRLKQLSRLLVCRLLR